MCFVKLAGAIKHAIHSLIFCSEMELAYFKVIGLNGSWYYIAVVVMVLGY